MSQNIMKMIDSIRLAFQFAEVYSCLGLRKFEYPEAIKSMGKETTMTSLSFKSKAIAVVVEICNNCFLVELKPSRYIYVYRITL